MEKIIQNKKADISITLLVIGVFAVCTIAILSFILNKNIGNPDNAVSVGIFENLSSQVENFYFYVNSGSTLQAAADKIGAQLNGNLLVLNAEQGGISVEYKIDLSK